MAQASTIAVSVLACKRNLWRSLAVFASSVCAAALTAARPEVSIECGIGTDQQRDHYCQQRDRDTQPQQKRTALLPEGAAAPKGIGKATEYLGQIADAIPTPIPPKTL